MTSETHNDNDNIKMNVNETYSVLDERSADLQKLIETIVEQL